MCRNCTRSIEMAAWIWIERRKREANNSTERKKIAIKQQAHCSAFIYICINKSVQLFVKDVLILDQQRNKSAKITLSISLTSSFMASQFFKHTCTDKKKFVSLLCCAFVSFFSFLYLSLCVVVINKPMQWQIKDIGKSAHFRWHPQQITTAKDIEIERKKREKKTKYIYSKVAND